MLPIVGIFKELRKMNYPGTVSLEYEIEEDSPMTGMKASFAYMRGVLAGGRQAIQEVARFTRSMGA